MNFVDFDDEWCLTYGSRILVTLNGGGNRNFEQWYGTDSDDK